LGADGASTLCARAREGAGVTSAQETLLAVESLRKEFPVRGGLGRAGGHDVHTAVDGISFSVRRGETLGIIGESGSGKSTTARCILRLIEPTSGSIRFRGQEITDMSRRSFRGVRRHMQIVFQNPYGSLDPRRSVGYSIAEPLAAYSIGNRASRTARVHELLDRVGLDRSVAAYRPAQFSGGERQRIAIARALALEPDLIVCDEPVSALDVSIQAQILNLLRELQDRLGLTYVFISHDIAVIRTVSDSVAVMQNGAIVESGPANRVCSEPSHPYTRALIDASAPAELRLITEAAAVGGERR
jgi:ABC-type oligopeptide transport system ATPase subunit